MNTDDQDTENAKTPTPGELRAMGERDLIHAASRFLEDELKYLIERCQIASLRGFWLTITCGPSYDIGWWRTAQEGAKAHGLNPALLYRLSNSEWMAEVFSRDMMVNSHDCDKTVTISLDEFYEWCGKPQGVFP